MLFELDSKLIHDNKVISKLIDNCNSMFEPEEIASVFMELKEQIINSLNEDLILKFLPSLNDMTEYEDFFEQFFKNKYPPTRNMSNEEKKKAKFLVNDHLSKMQMANGHLFLKLKEEEKGIKSFINALKNIMYCGILIS